MANSSNLEDPELALNAIEKSHDAGAVFIWLSLYDEVRKLPKFKEFMKEIGLVDYW